MFRWRFAGPGACLLFAVVVAACNLSAGDPEVESVGGSGAGTTLAPVTTPETTQATTPETAPATAATSPPETTGSTTTDTAAGDPATDGPVTFSSSIRPIIADTCASCHTGDGPGTPHIRFDTAGAVARTSWAIVDVVESGFMPPWRASAESVAFQGDWSLSDEEIAAIVEWDGAGSPLDVAAEDTIIPTNGVVGIAEPDVEVDASGSYDGEFGQPDEYRCFIYDPSVTETSYASEMEFIPQQTEVVHHAVGFLVSASDRAALDARDGADGQGGWSCFGFSPGRSAELVFVWAPGADPTEYPAGTGLRFDPGDFIVMQTHYHFEVEAPADRSTFAIEWADDDDVVPVQLSTYLAPAEIPCSRNESGPLCDRDAALAKAVEAYGQEGVLADALLFLCGYSVEDFAGMTDGTASSSCDWDVEAAGTIVSVFGHEHEIGKSFRLTLNPDTPDELVLLDIPEWDFDWQLIYEPVEEIVLERGDTIRVECSWDRAARDPKLEPAYVLWADGTNDEMCFSSVVTRPT